MFVYRIKELSVHLEKELAALNAIAEAATIEGKKLKEWYSNKLKTVDFESKFLSQLNRDKKLPEALKTLERLLQVYRKLENNAYLMATNRNIHQLLKAYIEVHDFAKPLCPERHDKLISDIMSSFDLDFNLWGYFGIEDVDIKRLLNLALRHHHILGVMVIGESNYLIYNELFEDYDFKRLDDNLKEVLFDLFLFHTAIDASAVGEGFLARNKLDRYFKVIDHVQNIREKKNRAALLRKISAETIEERIEWLLSSYDHLFDSRPHDYYKEMLPLKWSSNDNLISGMANIRRIVYGAKFLYSLAYQVENPDESHSLSQPAPGGRLFLELLNTLAKTSNLSKNIVEVHFKNVPQDTLILRRMIKHPKVVDIF